MDRVSPPPARRRSDAHIPIREKLPETEQPITSASTKPTHDSEEKRKKRALARIEKKLERKFDQIFTPWAGEDYNVSRHALAIILKAIDLMDDCSPQYITRTLNKAVNGGDGKRQPAGGRRPIKPYFDELITSLQSAKGISINGGRLDTRLSPLESDRQQLDQRAVQSTDVVSAKGTGPNRQSIPSDGSYDQVDRDLDLNPSPSAVLPQQKQARTTLFVRVPPALEYLPLRLSECMTSEAFYTKVLGAWGIRDDQVSRMTVTFTWMDPTDRMRTMIMNHKLEGCLAHLIEQVDDAPGWDADGKGKCALDVEITLKE